LNNAILRIGLAAVSFALLLSCGGGGGGTASDGGASAVGSTSDATSGLQIFNINGVASDGGGSGGPGGVDGGSDGSSTSASASGNGSGDSSGVGSGGTGATSASAGAGVGSADGAGSIIVNGLRYNTDTAVLSVEDAPALQLGMSVKVTGPMSADFTSGVARQIVSAADLRGPMSSVDLAGGSFVVMGTTVTTDNATVWADTAGLAALVPGTTLQVWGLPAGPGILLATRVEQHAAATPIVTGTVQNLDTNARSFTLGGSTVDYRTAAVSGGIDGRPLANGSLVRVRANAPTSPGALTATTVQWWYPVPLVDATLVQLAGAITDYVGTGSLRVLGVNIDASSAQITGGPASGIGNGVRVEIGGTISNGILKASKLKIRHVPGTGGPASFTLIGPVGAFASPASFKVRGQPVDAGGPDVEFVNGAAASLRNGTKITVEGGQVLNGVLLATRVTFD
jgi:hypothetical protein